MRPAIILLALIFPAAAPLEKSVAGDPLQPEDFLPQSTTSHQEAFEAAAAAMRRDDFYAARDLLTPLLRHNSSDPLSRVILGFYAHASEQLELTREMLEGTTDLGGFLEDWRLFLLADALQALGEQRAALESLTQLLETSPDSPLRTRTLIRIIELAQDEENWIQALGSIELARWEPLRQETSAQVETTAWAIGQELNNRAVLEDAARRLLVHHPLEASELQVVELFRQPDGKIDWIELLRPEALLERAGSLYDLKLWDGALDALELVPASDRDLYWSLTKARVLTARHEGSQAAAILQTEHPEGDHERTELFWHLAQAELDMSTARRRRHNLPAAERERMKSAALDHLRQIVDLGFDRSRSIDALKLLFRKSAEHEPFDEVMSTLRELRHLEPSDTTGARFLWREGWSAYTQRNYSGAVGYWSELEELYLNSSYSRRGRYWTARAHEHLGNLERAHDIYLRVANVDTADFYRRHAVSRLGDEPPANPATRPTQSWPEDPLLLRAEWLSGMALEGLALAELEALRERADPRAFHGAKAVTLARLGERRESIGILRAVFPALGGPHQAGVPEDARRLYYPIDYSELVQQHAEARRLSASLVFAMIRQESAFDPSARSRSGARGLMQMMPSTGRELARRMGLAYSTSRLSDPNFSIQLGTSYFRQVLEMFDGNEELALAGYNGGPYRIRRLWKRAGSPSELDYFVESLDLPETRLYVKRILVYSDSYRQLYSELG